MNRWFPHPARETLLGLTAALAGLCAACSPNNSVKAGAPVLTELIILQPGAPATATIVLPTTPDCAAALVDGDVCHPMVDGGTADTLCRQVAVGNWCSCIPGATDGAWSCPPFANVSAVIAIFDRVLDTVPFDTTYPAPSTTAAMLSASAGTTAPQLLTDYTSNGSTTGLIFPLLGHYVIGNFRVDGPSLFMTPTPAADGALPEFPSGAKMTITLNPLDVRAKDGKTQFTGAGPLQDGSISFLTAPFAASVSGPPPAGDASADAAPDMMPATISFTNYVDPAALAAHVTVTATIAGAATPVMVDLATADGFNVTVTPKTTWPASATITITVDAATPDLVGGMLGAAATGSFTTAAM